MGSIVQEATASGSGVSARTATLTNPVAAGNALILSVLDSETQSTNTPTNGGVTWVKVGEQQATADQGTLTVWYGLNATGGSGTAKQASVSVPGSSASLVIHLAEVNPIPNGLTQDEPSAGTVEYIADYDPGEAPPIQPAALATTRAYDLLYFVVGAINTSGGTPNLPSGSVSNAYTDLSQVRTTSGSPQVALRPAYRFSVRYGSYGPSRPITDDEGLAIHFALKVQGPPAPLEADATSKSGGVAMLSVQPTTATFPAVLAVHDRYLFGDADTDLSTLAIVVAKAVGVDDQPALRGADVAYTGLPGQQFFAKLPDSRVVTLNLYAFPLNPDGSSMGVDDRTASRRNLDSLQALFAVRRPQRLTRVMPDGSGRTAMAEVVKVTRIDRTADGLMYGLSVDFQLADPWFYGPILVDGPRSFGASPLTYTLTHPGDVIGHKVWFEFLGACTKPTVVNLNTGQSIEYQGTALGSTERLIVDCAGSAAYRNGASVIGDIAHFSPPGRPAALMEMWPGANPMQVTSTSPGGTVTTWLQPPYV